LRVKPAMTALIFLDCFFAPLIAMTFSPFTIHHSPFTIHHSLFTIHY
jgi:hypothetical protein